jgi:hypothetical protein
MKQSFSTAILGGLALLVLAHIGWAIAYGIGSYPEVVDWLLRLLPIGAAFVAALLAPKGKWIVGMSMVLFGTAISVLANFLMQAYGIRTDFPGKAGAMAMLLPAFLTYVVLCAAGSAAGVWYSRHLRGSTAAS